MFNHGPSAQTAMSSAPIVVQRDTRAWQLQVWVSFGIAVFLCAVGLAWLPGEPLEQVFMVMGYVFCLSTVFALAKMLRDRHEADLLEARLQGRREAAQAAAQNSSVN